MTAAATAPVRRLDPGDPGADQGWPREALERTGTANALLTATPMGKPPYEAVGFRTVGQCATHGGTPADVEPDPGTALRSDPTDAHRLTPGARPARAFPTQRG